jgi:hypothetical protein
LLTKLGRYGTGGGLFCKIKIMTKAQIIEKVIADGVVVSGELHVTQDGQMFPSSAAAFNYWKKLKADPKLAIVVVTANEIAVAKTPQSAAKEMVQNPKAKK